ncbi:T9SS type B sorting domain-containing protein [Salibacter halophilus]|uniref:T9SS type B sorting domain-containing protein n=1 Tax=Salibacter halophilus TaxID=1803916 RepID=A0A6N6MAK8_9FLAO|nr:gliding motility-associated C-terminal domain-containing protein [Salibacter halophilus]KAB1065740.1 T9SS type B sorting domain-containing protein [Salibacter halophilus]
MKKQDNIADFFKQRFEKHEMPVDESVWQGVQSKMNAGTAGGSSAGLGNVGGWIAAGVAAVGITGAAIYFSSQSEPESTTSQPVAQNEELVDQAQTDSKSAEDFQFERESETAKKESEQKEQAESNAKSNTTNQESTDQSVESSASQGSDQNELSQSTTSSGNEGGESGISTEAADKVMNIGKSEAEKESIKEAFKSRISASPLSGAAPLTISLGSSESLKRARWDFGDGSDPVESTDVDHTYNEPGSYTVTLLGENAGGKVFMDKIKVNVKQPEGEAENIAASSIDVGNFITPNGDNINDEFVVETENIQEFNIVILSKAGSIIFESNSPELRWKGTEKSGNLCPEGIYYYQITARGKDGKLYAPKGFIELRR